MAISQSFLLGKSNKYIKTRGFKGSKDSIDFDEIFDPNDKTAFLCHSHNDEALAKGLQVIFNEAGVDLYIDWQDNTMPDSPNAETANKIKSRIRRSNVFLYLATQNSRDSRWCPWEIGNADSSKKKILIIPTSDGNYTYGSEYLELYPKIDIGQVAIDNRSIGHEAYGIFQPGCTRGQLLSNSSF